MKNYIDLLIETLKKQIKKNEIYIKSSRNREAVGYRENIERYEKNITDMEEKILDFKSGKVSVSYSVIPNIHTNTILNTYIHNELNWFGSSTYNEIEKTTKELSVHYNISLYDSLRILNLADSLMSLEARLITDPMIKKILEEKNSERSKNYKEAEELKKDIKKVQEEILFILNKKYISTEGFARLYIKRLELDRGYSKAFDEFLDWLIKSTDYGVISSFCEFDKYYKYRCDFENEKINLKDFENEF